jgi:hypothetical protein
MIPAVDAMRLPAGPLRPLRGGNGDRGVSSPKIGEQHESEPRAVGITGHHMARPGSAWAGTIIASSKQGS